MEFGEKLFNLRKNEGMSQEALAEKLNTSRQAISKWENGQGFPETEKLLKIGNVFNVSIDYLLKNKVEDNKEKENGYYVSKEMAESFLIHERKASKYGSAGISTIFASIIPYLIFKESFEIYSIIIGIMVAAGFGLIVAVSFMEEEYKILKRETLILDEKFLKELNAKYNGIKKKYIKIIILGAFFIVLGGAVLFLFKNGLGAKIAKQSYYIVCTFLIIIGIYIVVYFATVMESYELLVKNDEYVNKLSYKLFKIIRKKTKNL